MSARRSVHGRLPASPPHRAARAVHRARRHVLRGGQAAAQQRRHDADQVGRGDRGQARAGRAGQARPDRARLAGSWARRAEGRHGRDGAGRREGGRPGRGTRGPDGATGGRARPGEATGKDGAQGPQGIPGPTSAGIGGTNIEHHARGRHGDPRGHERHAHAAREGARVHHGDVLRALHVGGRLRTHDRRERRRHAGPGRLRDDQRRRGRQHRADDQQRRHPDQRAGRDAHGVAHEPDHRAVATEAATRATRGSWRSRSADGAGACHPDARAC